VWESIMNLLSSFWWGLIAFPAGWMSYHRGRMEGLYVGLSESERKLQEKYWRREKAIRKMGDEVQLSINNFEIILKSVSSKSELNTKEIIAETTQIRERLCNEIR
jgi:hypothetical protein